MRPSPVVSIDELDDSDSQTELKMDSISSQQPKRVRPQIGTDANAIGTASDKKVEESEESAHEDVKQVENENPRRELFKKKKKGAATALQNRTSRM